MPKKKKPFEKPSDQFKRFQATSEELEVDDTKGRIGVEFQKLTKQDGTSKKPKNIDRL